jgi:hypothetical protein
MSSLAIWSLIGANASGLPDQVCDESAGEAHHKDGCGCHGHQVNGPRAVAFAHKVEVPRAAFVSIQVKMHTAASDKAPCTQNTTFCGRLGDTLTHTKKGVLAAAGAEVIVDRLLGQDDVRACATA